MRCILNMIFSLCQAHDPRLGDRDAVLLAELHRAVVASGGQHLWHTWHRGTVPARRQMRGLYGGGRAAQPRKAGRRQVLERQPGAYESSNGVRQKDSHVDT